MGNLYSGAEIVFKCLEDQKVEHIFGYPGGAVLPIYDELKNHPTIKHILVRHEQGAGHAAEGYARSTGKPGVVLVTSGPGATNVVTALTDAYMDSVPLVCISGQVPTHLIGTDAFQECDTTGITRPCTKHNWLVKDINDLPRIMHEAFEVATTGRPGPVLVDIPKDIQFAKTKMEQTIVFVGSELGKIRTGRANPDMFNKISVKYYDNDTPLNQIANISVMDAVTISIQPFDKTSIDDIERGILASDLGFNPSNNGNSIIITFPPLSAERRQDLVKVASKVIEDGRISVRNIRREIIQSVKKVEEDEKIPEDDMKRFMDQMQDVTDSFIKRLNANQQAKEEEILNN